MQKHPHNPERVLISQTISRQRNITIATEIEEGSVELRRGEIRFRQSWHHRSFNTRFVTFKYEQYSSFKQFSGSVTFWCGSGSVPLTNGSGWGSQNSGNQDVSSFLCLLKEGSGSGSVQIHYGSGCGSRRPKNIRTYGS
jgi:hypothetical protein